MSLINHPDLIQHALKVLHPRKLYLDNTAGGVACALQTVSGNIFYGVCIDIGSGIGFCAEHSAIAAMITSGESAIASIVAVCEDGRVLPPCGRCRELMYEIDPYNLTNTRVVLSENRAILLAELLPHPYHEAWAE